MSLIIGKTSRITFGGLAVMAIGDLKVSMGDATKSTIGCVKQFQIIDDTTRCRFLHSKKARIRRKWWKRLSRKYDGYVSNVRPASWLPMDGVITIDFKWDTPPAFPLYDERA